MELIKTQDVWVPVSIESKNPLKWIVQTSDNEMVVIEKKLDMVVMTKEELKKIISNSMDKVNKWEYENSEQYNRWKENYINQIIK